MKYCQHCGNQIKDDVTICPKCGCYVASIAVSYKYEDRYELNWRAF